MTALVFKLVSVKEWRVAEAAGVFDGSQVDRQDGFIHFSTAAQVRETAAKHFTGQADLLLVAIDATAVSLAWEPSRGGDLFPHLYAPLLLTAVRWQAPLPLGEDGLHQFPPL